MASPFFAFCILVNDLPLDGNDALNTSNDMNHIMNQSFISKLSYL